YVLAHALTAARGDHPAAFAAYERTMAAPVAGSRAMARVNAKTIVPGTDWGARALLGVARTVSVLPSGLTKRLARLNSNGVRLYDTMPLPD
ncbi:MAG: FAD-dependent oxidoreductase, partial [Actinobacteria bacterium]|nr:FAD-dependent oxidoreductase [Actinomycetota bacterium]